MDAHDPKDTDLRSLASGKIRQLIRAGYHDGHTAGLAAGRLQCNLAILSEDYALDFLRFCQRNPKPCQVVGVGDTGNPMLPTLGSDIDEAWVNLANYPQAFAAPIAVGGPQEIGITDLSTPSYRDLVDSCPSEVAACSA